MKRVLLVGGILLVLGAACTNDRGPDETATELPPPEGMPQCDEVFADGQTIDGGTFADACIDADGEMTVPRPVVHDCEDGRKMRWNDFAWGYDGEEMQLFEANDDVRLPMDEAMECLGTQPAADPQAG